MGPELTAVLKEHGRLARLMEPYQNLLSAREDIAGAKEMLSDPEMAELAKEELPDGRSAEQAAVDTIKQMLTQADPTSDRPAIVEIRAGAGGDEACLFAGELLRMYQMFADEQGWKIESLSVSPAEVGGLKEGTFLISGTGAYGLLSWESGGHRVQRVPATETQGRVHTSAATVAVLAEAEEVDVDINPADLRLDTYRASGAGGQHVNKTDSAVRIVHEPTGIVVQCQDEKSQHANKDRAMKMLRAKLFEAERQRVEAERAAQRKGQVGTGDRSDRIRTYNFPQNRLSDHRINYTAYNLDKVMIGHLQEVQQALLDDAKVRVLEDWDGSF